MVDDRSKSTATLQNAMSPSERDEFLNTARVTRISTLRKDGFAHTAPAWFLWCDGVFMHSIGAGRMHLRNLARDDRLTECIDIDERVEGKLDARTAGVVCFGRAEIISDVDENVKWNRRILSKYLKYSDLERYLAFSIGEIEAGRRIVKVRPERLITWDYGKNIEP
ncbi:MAG: hypothetical protein DLM61_25055 [Pseudonocardiales bacterium]|nr:MAG: hypothetical protein DLM61_25055 [Pseudonocardiales bacterium]